MPEANKITKDEQMVDIDTSGPETEVSLPEETVETVEAVEETILTEPVSEPKQESKKQDEKLEDYSQGVQSRIAKLTRKMRAAASRLSASLILDRKSVV